MRSLALLLRSIYGSAVCDYFQSFDYCLTAEYCKPVKKLASIFFGQNINLLLQKDISAVHRQSRTHYRNTCLALTVDKTPLYRAATSVLRQKRSVNIDYSVFGNIENFLTDYLPESTGNHYVGIDCFYILDALFTNTFVLIYLNTFFDGKLLYGAKTYLASVAFSVRLSNYAYNLVVSTDYSLKCRDRKVGRA